MMILQSVILLLTTTQIGRYWCYVWKDQPCSSDIIQAMPEGIQENNARFPWLGVVQHTFYLAGKTRYAITGAVLIHPIYAIASAEDITKIFPEQIKNNTQLFFWGKPKEAYSLDVKDYILHPQYKAKVTSASLALIGLVPADETGFSEFRAPVLPVCLPLVGGGVYEDMYAVKMTDETGELQKEVFKMDYVLDTYCDQFYAQNELSYPNLNPVNPICAVSTFNRTVCVWDAGTALIVKQAWGFWQLIGFALRGPGCGAPTKFLNIHDYLPWINDVITSRPYIASEEEFKIGLRRQSPSKVILYNAHIIPRYHGQCNKYERGGVLYKDEAHITVNKHYAVGFYYLAVSQIAQFFCAEVHMIEATRRSENSIWIEHNCHSEISGSAIDGQPRSGDMRRLECFIYFKSTAFIEFRFSFSYKVIVAVVLYGKPQKYREFENIYKKPLVTTPWWPTQHNTRLRTGNFVPINVWWYSL